MTQIEKINDLLQQMQPDLRLETVLADLVSDGMSMDDFIVMSNSLFKRNYHRDIEKAGEIQYEQSRKKKCCFLVNREGLYDQVPEDLFHQPLDSSSQADKKDIIREIKVQDELEKSSRLFFLPFEQELYRQRVTLEVEERSFLSAAADEDPEHNFFDELWNLPDFLSNAQKTKLCTLIPVLNKISGDLQLASFIMEHITGYQAGIEESAPCKSVLAEELRLGDARLGMDYILGGEVMELQSSVTIKIFLADTDSLIAFFPGGEKIKIFEFISSLLIPYEKDIIYELVFPQNPGFVLSAQDEPGSGRLNYTTII